MFVVDAQILACASDEKSEHAAICIAVLNAIRESDVRIVVDEEGFILQQYEDHTSASSFARKWLKGMLETDRVLFDERMKIDGDTRSRLEHLGFKRTHEDFKYHLRTAATSEASIITLDPHFDRISKIVKKRLGVTVYSPAEVIDQLASAAGVDN